MVQNKSKALSRVLDLLITVLITVAVGGVVFVGLGMLSCSLSSTLQALLSLLVTVILVGVVRRSCKSDAGASFVDKIGSEIDHIMNRCCRDVLFRRFHQ